MSRGGFGLLFYFVDIVEDKKTVDFVKGKTTHPVGAGLVFPRGFNEKVVTPSGEVWLKTGVVETDKSKFDVDSWRRPALTTLICNNTPYDTTTAALRVFT